MASNPTVYSGASVSLSGRITLKPIDRSDTILGM